MILVAVALTVGTTEAVIMLVIQLVYQQLENYVIYPIVYRRAVELTGFTTIAAVLIAGSLLGVVGAILAVPFAAVIKTVLREAGAPRRARMEALRAGCRELVEAGFHPRQALILRFVQDLGALGGEDRDGDARDERDQADPGEHQHGADEAPRGGCGTMSP